MNSSDIQALLSNEATIETRIEILPLSPDGDVVVLTQDNAIIDWQHEDFRYVSKEGWIGQFVARKLTCNIKNITDDFYIGDREIVLYLGIKIEDNTTWYCLGNFLVNKIEEDEVKDVTAFEGLDYTKKFNKVYEDEIEYPCTASALAQNVCEQCGCELGSTLFKNSDYIIEGNVFTNNESCREVMKQIGKLAFSWVRVDWDNKIYIDFQPETTVQNENKIDNSKYYDLTTKKDIYGPINKVSIGYSMISGEQTFISDEEGIAKNGEIELSILDNPLVYTQEQRESIIQSASSLLGLSYRPCEFTTIGHPWLKGNEKLEIIDMEDVSHETYPFDRTIEYFGHIKTKIKSSAMSDTNQQYGYTGIVLKTLKNVQIVVDKVDGTITSTVENVTSLSGDIKTLNGDIEALTKDQDVISGQVTKLQQDLNSFDFRIVNIENNGVTKVQNTLVTIDIEGIKVATNESAISTLITNSSFIIRNYDETLAQFNNDGAVLDNLTVRQYFIAGVHRQEKYTDEETGELRTGWFYVGGEE